MFKKLVAIEPVGLIPSAEEKLFSFAEDVIMYHDIPVDDNEMARRIVDADAMHFFGADISYFARSEKDDAKTKGYRFLPLERLLAECEVIYAAALTETQC